MNDMDDRDWIAEESLQIYADELKRAKAEVTRFTQEDERLKAAIKPFTECILENTRHASPCGKCVACLLRTAVYAAQSE